MATENAYLFFDVPGGRLAFGDGDLDIWAEHLAWCYRMMGVGDGATVAVQDFGSSPISFLGSSLLMPGLRRGVAERIDGRFICLDASAERVTLTPALLAQLDVDALVIREDMLELLSAELDKRGFPALAQRSMKTIVVFGDEPARFQSGPLPAVAPFHARRKRASARSPVRQVRLFPSSRRILPGRRTRHSQPPARRAGLRPVARRNVLAFALCRGQRRLVYRLVRSRTRCLIGDA